MYSVDIKIKNGTKPTEANILPFADACINSNILEISLCFFVWTIIEYKTVRLVSGTFKFSTQIVLEIFKSLLIHVIFQISRTWITTTQIEVPDGKSIFPDPDERPRAFKFT